MKDKDPRKRIIEEHEAHIREFDNQPEPEAYCCFVWPDIATWQAIAAYKQHEVLIPRVHAMFDRVWSESGRDPETMTDADRIGLALNALAEMILMGADVSSTMGPMLLFVSRTKQTKWMLAVCSQVHRAEGPGMLADLKVMTGVRSVNEARDWVNRHPLIIKAKIDLIKSKITGPRH